MMFGEPNIIGIGGANLALAAATSYESGDLTSCEIGALVVMSLLPFGGMLVLHWVESGSTIDPEAWWAQLVLASVAA